MYLSHKRLNSSQIKRIVIVLSNLVSKSNFISVNFIFAKDMYRRLIVSAFTFILLNIVSHAQTGSDNALPDINVQSVLAKGRFIKVYASKTKVYAGEPFEVTYKFYEQVTSNPSVLQQPDFDGYSVQELPSENGSVPEALDGEIYKTYIIRKVQLTAPEPGKHILGKCIVEDLVSLPDPANPAKDITYKFSVSSKEVMIDVLPLPANTKPPGFYGITGNFSMQVSALKDSLGLNETGHLLVTISGSGNIDAVNSPEIKWPAGIEHFEGSDTQQVNNPDFPINSNRTFDIPFTGKQAGMIMIPPVSFVYFNPATQKYQTIKSDSIPVFFSAGSASTSVIQPIYQDDITNRKYLWIVPAIAIVVIAGGIISYRKNKKEEQRILALKKEKADIMAAKQILFKQEEEKKQPEDFKEQITALLSLTDRKEFFISVKNLVTTITDKNHSNGFNHAAAESLLKQCNYHIYSPIDEEFDREQVLQALQNMIKKI